MPAAPSPSSSPPPAPRRLRLSELLEELGALDDEAAAAASSMERAQTHISVGDIVDRSADAGFGLLIALLALLAIPFFGLSTPFGLAIGLCGLQMLVGKHRPWLPGVVRRRQLSLAMLDRVAGMLLRRTGWLRRITRKRGELLLAGPGWVFIGLGLTLQALALALPLPIPGSNMIFLIPILIYAIGILERDALLIGLGHVATVANMTLLVVFGRLVLEVLQRAWTWVAG